MLTAGDTLARLEEHGYTTSLEAGRLKVRGPAAPGPELEQAIKENRDALKAAVLLSDPPAWLARLFDLYWSDHETPVRLSGPSGKAETYLVSVSIKNLCAAVAAEIGAPVLEWERLLPEVEEALGSWEVGEVVPFTPEDAEVSSSGPPIWKRKSWTAPDQRTSPAGDAYDRMVEDRMAGLLEEEGLT